MASFWKPAPGMFCARVAPARMKLSTVQSTCTFSSEIKGLVAACEKCRSAFSWSWRNAQTNTRKQNSVKWLWLVHSREKYARTKFGEYTVRWYGCSCRLVPGACRLQTQSCAPDVTKCSVFQLSAVKMHHQGGHGNGPLSTPERR